MSKGVNAPLTPSEGLALIRPLAPPPPSALAGRPDSPSTQARRRLGAPPLKLLFHRTCRPLAPAGLPGVWHGPWLVVALDGSVVEAPDTPANRRALGCASNQHGDS